MEFIKGISIEIDTMNMVLKIAYLKNYLDKNYNPFQQECDYFKFNNQEQMFEIHISNTDKYIYFEMNKFMECYTLFISNKYI